MGKQGTVIDGVRLVPLRDDLDPPDYVERSDIERLQEQITANAERLIRLARHAPSVAAKRTWLGRLAAEIAGVATVATGAWWIYPPATLLLVGAWLLGDVLASRRTETDA